MAVDPITALLIADGLINLGVKIHQISNKSMSPEEETALIQELNDRIAATLTSVEAYKPKPIDG